MDWRSLLWVAVCVVWAQAGVATEYATSQQLGRELKELQKGHRRLVWLGEAGETPGKKSVWLVELGAGQEEERRRRPAMLVVAGIEGNDLAGTASVLSWLRGLAEGYGEDEAIRKLLDSTTIYAFPRLNPDGVEHFFVEPIQETLLNDRPVDDDHDGLVDEDGPDDLDGNGLISWMRVEDPEGEYVLDPGAPRLLIKADGLKGEKGSWRYLREGLDNDGDGAWNEDGTGGVNFNRNFPYNYSFFAPWAGLHQVSEAETRLLADFVVAHPNIGVVFSFGAGDNLMKTPKSEAEKRPPETIRGGDVPFYGEFGKLFREVMGVKKELSGHSEPGTFSDWMYYHRGRLSLAAQPWTPELQLAVSWEDEKPEDDPADGRDGKEENAEAGREERNREERAFLAWIEGNVPERFLEWRELEHPDFPGKKVEVGGYAPYARSDPPGKVLAELTARHGKFLTLLAGKLPRVGIRRVKVKALGDAVYEIAVQVENTGYLPTSLEQGETTGEVYPTRVELRVEDEAVLGGSKRHALGPIPGSGGMKEVRAVILARTRKKVEVEVISALGGTAKTMIDLEEGR